MKRELNPSEFIICPEVVVAFPNLGWVTLYALPKTRAASRFRVNLLALVAPSLKEVIEVTFIPPETLNPSFPDPVSASLALRSSVIWRNPSMFADLMVLEDVCAEV
jgi:hypothetical protein